MQRAMPGNPISQPALSRLSLLAAATLLAAAMLAWTSAAPALAKPLSGSCNVWSQIGYAYQSWTDPNTGVGISLQLQLFGYYNSTTGASCNEYYTAGYVYNNAHGANGYAFDTTSAYYCYGNTNGTAPIPSGGLSGSNTFVDTTVLSTTCGAYAYGEVDLADGFKQTLTISGPHYTPIRA